MQTYSLLKFSGIMEAVFSVLKMVPKSLKPRTKKGIALSFLVSGSESGVYKTSEVSVLSDGHSWTCEFLCWRGGGGWNLVFRSRFNSPLGLSVFIPTPLTSLECLNHSLCCQGCIKYTLHPFCLKLGYFESCSMQLVDKMHIWPWKH